MDYCAKPVPEHTFLGRRHRRNNHCHKYFYVGSDSIATWVDERVHGATVFIMCFFAHRCTGHMWHTESANERNLLHMKVVNIYVHIDYITCVKTNFARL